MTGIRRGSRWGAVAAGIGAVVLLGTSMRVAAQQDAGPSQPPSEQESPPGTEGGIPDGAEPTDEAPESAGGTSVPSPSEAAAQATSTDQESPLRLVVVDAATYGIDPVVGRHVTHRMRETASAAGYEVVGPEATVQAAQRLQMPYPPSPADLWRVTWVAQAQRGAFARVWAHEGRYVVEITVASLDGTGPFFARGTASAQGLHSVVERLTKDALPVPGRWDAEAAKRLTERPADGGPERGTAREPEGKTDFERGSDAQRIQRESHADDGEPKAPLRRWQLALQTEAAIGTAENTFYNHLVGARLDFRIARDILLGAYFGYANLEGREGRVHQILPALQFENRVRISSKTDITIPLRFAVGYLPFNGPVLRLAAGVNIPLSDRVELHFDLLTPTFWVLPERDNGNAVSLNVAGELVFRL